MVENQGAVRSTSKKRLASRRLAAKAEPRASSERPAVAFPIVGVGASAGGLEAFRELLRTLPTDTGMAFVLVQHLDPDHESALTQLLAKTTALSVREVANNVAVKPNHVYVIPRNTSLSITRGVLHLQTRELTRGIHRPIDLFFESLAQDQHENAIGVILSGTATDGTLGLEAVKAEGGITFAQDESAKYDSMPRSAIAAGCVDFVLKPEDIAKELARIAKHPVVVGQPSVLSLLRKTTEGPRRHTRMMKLRCHRAVTGFLRAPERRARAPKAKQPISKPETMASKKFFSSSAIIAAWTV
jgi:two-component system, chemotaxis family, CheB/CheR fusion protein